jgi:hypothetical protein
MQKFGTNLDSFLDVLGLSLGIDILVVNPTISMGSD